MRFSVITITKDTPDGLAKTKVSVRGQRFTNYEWIVIDGAKEPDQGIYDAMNKGIERATGEFLIFLNAGDEFASHNVLTRLAEQEADFIYGDAIEAGHLKTAKAAERINRGMITHHQAMAYKRAVIGDLRYDLNYIIAADYKFTLQFLKQAESVAYVPIAICVFAPDGVSQRYAHIGRREEQAIRREMGINALFTPVRQWLAFRIKSLSHTLYLKIRMIA